VFLSYFITSSSLEFTCTRRTVAPIHGGVVTLCYFEARAPGYCLQAVTGCFIAENPFRSVIGRHLGFLRRALPGTSGRGQKSRERGGGGKGKPPAGRLGLSQDKI